MSGRGALASDLARARQADAEQRRADQLVDRDERHQQHLHLAAPGRETPSASTEASPSVMPACEMRPVQTYAPVRRSMPRRPQSGRHAESDQGDARRDERQRHEPDLQRAHRAAATSPIATKNTTSTGSAPRWIATFSASPCGDRDVLDHQPGGHRRQQRLEALRRADLAEQHAHAEQDEGDFAPDVAQIQRERARPPGCQTPARRRFPTRAARARSRRRRHPRQAPDARSCMHHREQDERDEIREHDDREHEVAQAPARARFRNHGGRHRRREADDDDDEQRDHRELGDACGVRGHGQPRPGHPGHGEQSRAWRPRWSCR